ncbi:murein biosynthesis integral membrane protein MurJ, partial [Corynebacterium nasicanis]
MPDNLRSRFVAATPPAPVPEQRAAPPVPPTDRSRLRAPEPSGVASDADVVRAGGSMAIATLFSRITGFLRNLLIVVTLGGAVGSAFNTANTLPNLITEIVLGAVLTSLVVPVLVRAEKEDADRGTAFFRRLFTLSASLLLAVTALSLIAAPLLTRLMLDEDGEVNVIQSTSFAYLLLPQIFFYGIFALFMAVLNTRGIFKPGAWAPVANNVVSIAVLLAYMLLPGELEETAPSGVIDPHVLLLGLGTTLGVIVQAAILVPYLRRAGVDLRPLWGIDERLKQFGGMAVAIVAYVAVSQLGYVITTRIASLADAAAPLIYQQHWLLLQVPYGIIGVTLLTAIMPRLSRNAADGDDRAVVADLNLATKLTFIALIPIVVFFTAFGPDIGVALFAYRNFDTESGMLLGLTLSFSAFTLLPYALVLLHLRVFYAREEAWTPTYIIIGITATKIVLSLLAPVVATSPARVVILLGAANGFGFIAGAVIGALLLRRKLGHLGTRSQIHTTAWAFAASLVGVAAALLVDRILPSFEGLGSFGVLIKVAVSGVVFLIATGIALSYSRLPEVQNLGRAFARIPGLSRFVRPDTSRAIEVGESNAQEVSAQITALDPFVASPAPAPMSAGVVRGPRLVPGA